MTDFNAPEFKEESGELFDAVHRIVLENSELRSMLVTVAPWLRKPRHKDGCRCTYCDIYNDIMRITGDAGRIFETR